MSIIPLEANPEVMNKFLHFLGVPDKWAVCDVFGLEEDTLAWVPRPVLGLIFLCPGTEQFVKHINEQSEQQKQNDQDIDPEVFYMKQCVSNTCGTVALLHCVANNSDKLGIQDGPFKVLLENATKLTPEERGELLFKSGSSDGFNLVNTHQQLAMEGQSQANCEEAHNHFLALVEKGGYIYQLDGSRFPINHGPTTPDHFLEDAANICRDFISRDAEMIKFTVLALSAADN